ncbi:MULTISPECIES: helicase-related protein [Methylobacterium]|jgi:ATP-dependent RNA helicase SUPV3L1/SUV3|uniref:helicase-related protein n=4 Tax=Methylobacteriaceae TaxID=119045 RepID=UPI0008DFF73D|nr:helicase-related protein [Methylobacterium sp. yr596]MBZ6415946.1 helicase [Methylobacterium sp.]SFF33099.1 ATP-dependent RNA helicase SUPV3L1/SUV3 [Methylobacterium sp. yr596]
MTRRSLSPQARLRGATAVLGPTNTGKTHLAIERMLGHPTGMIGLPLRLLAREVYHRVVERVGPERVALVTGEEKIKPNRPSYWICTAEAMPRDNEVDFVGIDEIQLGADRDRGHTFTDRLLHQRGREETLLIGSATMEPLVKSLIPGIHVTTRPRLSQLSFAGSRKLSRLPHRSAIVAFSAEEVYAIAELLRRQRGGAAVVLGALSPRTRNAQVELYQSGEVDYLVATDAVGMGLNLDVDHVAFASNRKYDGTRFRDLSPSEMAQIAGRAGRHLRDGTFGTTGRCPPLDAEMVEALESHTFEPLRMLQWRNPDLDFRSVDALRRSLGEHPSERGLTRAPTGDDEAALDLLAKEDDIRDYATSRSAVERLWQVCGVPDYRKSAIQTHADLIAQLFRFLMRGMAGRIPVDWFSQHVAMVDRTDGDIDALSQRIAHVRTWTFVANRPDWLADPEHWQGETRRVEDRLSDALHERLASRFVDRRTSVLMRRLRENTMLEAEITAGGDVTVEGQHVGHLHGFQFVPDPGAEGQEAKTLRSAAEKALASEIEARADRFAAAADAALVLSNDGTIRWTGNPVAKLVPGEKLYAPGLRLLADEQLTGAAREKVEGRLEAWLKAHIVRLLGPALELETAADVTGLARGIGFQVAEALGVLERAKVLNEMRSLDQDGRGALRKHGVRFGAYHITMPALLKPAPRTLAAQLWALQNGGLDQRGLDEIAHLAGSGRTSMPVDPEIAKGLYRAAGFRVCGGRAVRVDILERLADLIRPAIAYVPGTTPGEPPPGAADKDGFVPTVGMTSLVGCSGEDFASILKSLGYVVDRRPGPAITVALRPSAPTVPVQPRTAEETAATATDGEAGETAQDPAAQEDAPQETGAQETSTQDAVPQDGSDHGNPAPEAVTADAPADEAPAEASMEDAPVEAAAAEEPAPTAEAVGDEAAVATGEPETAEATEGASDEGRSEPVAAAGAEAGAEDAAAADAPAEPAEPIVIEVWRMHRHQRNHAPRHQGRGRPQDGQGPREGQQRDRSRGFPRPDQRPEGGEGAPAEQRANRSGPREGQRWGDRRPAENRPAGEGRPEGRFEGRGGENRGNRDGRPPRGPHPGGREGGRPPQDRRDGAPRGGGMHEARPPRRDRAPDPDSPFAKLLALKAQMESRDGDKR